MASNNPPDGHRTQLGASPPTVAAAALGSAQVTQSGAALGEFALIDRFFVRPTGERQGIGDDCALIDVGDQTLALTSDMLIEGVHFLADALPHAVGHKSLAVNLSDLAAAGAQPRCFLLALALPGANPQWLEDYARGLFSLADAHGCSLVGGDTTRVPHTARAAGPLTIAITALGSVDRRRYRGRSGARPGDDIWVSGRLGEAALALDLRLGRRQLSEPDRTACLLRMDYPQPRVLLGRALVGLATAMIDISDGLLGDLTHILERSGAAWLAQPAGAGTALLGADLYWPSLPRAAACAGLDSATQYRCVLAGGDDYELLFTARPTDRAAVAALGSAAVPVARIGRIDAQAGLRLRAGTDCAAPQIELALHGFDHFLTPYRDAAGTAS